MKMELGAHLGFAGLIMAFGGIALAFLWPSKTWIGWICLASAAVLGITWLMLWLRQSRPSETKSQGRLAPVLLWTTPKPITEGDAISAKQLNATSNVPGTFAYNPTFGSIPPVGSQTLSVTFTPDDAARNILAYKTVLLTVKRHENPRNTQATSGADGLSQITIYKPYELLQPQPDRPVLVNIFWENAGPSTLEVLQRARVILVASTTGRPVVETELPNLESANWKSFTDNKKNVQGDATTTLPPGKRFVTVEGPMLTREQATDLVNNTGEILVWIFGRFEWSTKDGGKHKYDFCAFTTGAPAVFHNCQHHNGP